MKKQFLVIFILLTLQMSFGQKNANNVNIKWSPLFSEKKWFTYHILGEDANGDIYVNKKKGENETALYRDKIYKLYLSKFNKKLIRTKNETFIFEYNKKKLLNEFQFYLDNKIYLFSSFRNNKQKKYYLFYKTLNKKTFKPNKELNKVAEIDYKGHSKYNPILSQKSV